jgi:hypothetical protein
MPPNKPPLALSRTGQARVVALELKPNLPTIAMQKRVAKDGQTTVARKDR